MPHHISARDLFSLSLHVGADEDDGRPVYSLGNDGISDSIVHVTPEQVHALAVDLAHAHHLLTFIEDFCVFRANSSRTAAQVADIIRRKWSLPSVDDTDSPA